MTTRNCAARPAKYGATAVGGNRREWGIFAAAVSVGAKAVYAGVTAGMATRGGMSFHAASQPSGYMTALAIQIGVYE